jgi:type II secretory pathway pseudopilin PulG
MKLGPTIVHSGNFAASAGIFGVRWHAKRDTALALCEAPLRSGVLAAARSCFAGIPSAVAAGALPTRSKRLGRTCAAFTLAEVLAALVFMAIVIPVAVQGLRVANLAGQVGERKAVAARIAERALNELIATGQWQQTARNGTVQEDQQEYRWQMRMEPWSEGSLQVVTVQVTFPVQGQDYDVSISTLVDTATQ